jgi:hypothetical protein
VTVIQITSLFLLIGLLSVRFSAMQVLHYTVTSVKKLVYNESSKFNSFCKLTAKGPPKLGTTSQFNLGTMVFHMRSIHIGALSRLVEELLWYLINI